MIVTRRSLMRLPLGMFVPAQGMTETKSAEIPDRVLIALATEYGALAGTLRDLLVADLRDTDEIPGYFDLDDRRLKVLTKLSEIPARTICGLMAKAHVLMLRFSSGRVDVDHLSQTLAEDLLTITGMTSEGSQTFGLRR